MPSIPAMLAEVAANALKKGAKGKTLELMDPFMDLRKELGTVAPKSTVPQPAVRAFHGSPHSFDKFSLDKIGTGEGAQAYGHGLYFAENEGIAKSYRDTLSHNPHDAVNDIIDRVSGYGGDKSQLHGVIKSELFKTPGISHLGDDDKIVADIATAIREKNPDGTVTNEALAAYRRLSKAMPDKPGSMYEVKINADPEHFLDWDKPLSEQPHGPAVEAMLGKSAYPGMSASSAYHALADVHGTPFSGSGVTNSVISNEPAAAQALREAGIPGIKYLDAGSRPDMGRALQLREEAKKHAADGNHDFAADALKLAKDIEGSGSRNYVVFDDKLVEIVKKYGIAAALGAGLISQEMAAHMQEQGIDKKDILDRPGILDTPGLLGGSAFPDYRRKA